MERHVVWQGSYQPTPQMKRLLLWPAIVSSKSFIPPLLSKRKLQEGHQGGKEDVLVFLVLATFLVHNLIILSFLNLQYKFHSDIVILVKKI